MELEVKLTEALLGAEKLVHTLDGEVTLKIPTGIKHGTILRVKNKGVPQDAGRRGDLYARVSVHLPDKLSKESHKLVEDLKKLGL